MYQYSNRTNETKLRKTFLIIALISVIPFLFLVFRGLTDSHQFTETDYKVGAFFYNLRTPMRTGIATVITRIADVKGQAITTILITGALLLMKKWRTGLWFGLTVLFGAAGLNGLMKEIFSRVRPDQIDHLVEQGGYSFPSGHAMGSMIIYGGLLFILFRYMSAKGTDWFIGKLIISIILGTLILFIGLSRIYLGVHFPSDVLGGFALGLSWLTLLIALIGLKVTNKDFQSRNKYRFNRL